LSQRFKNVRSSRGLPVALIAALLLAGCAGGGSPKDVGVTQDSDPKESLMAGRGVISGRIIDDESVPVPNATVTLDKDGATRRTDANGDFRFINVLPGNHTLTTQVAGYDVKTVSFHVRAGYETELKITINIQPVIVPYLDVIPFSGRFDCTLAVSTMFYYNCLVNRTLQDTVFPTSKNTFFFRKAANAKQIVSELSWVPATAGTGQELDFSVIGVPREGCQWYANTYGPSRLKIINTIGVRYQDERSATPTGTCGDPIIDEPDTELGVLMFASPTRLAGQALIGLTVQQPYEGFITVAVHQTVAADYTAFPSS
jgi:hypothetical protein